MTQGISPQTIAHAGMNRRLQLSASVSSTAEGGHRTQTCPLLQGTAKIHQEVSKVTEAPVRGGSFSSGTRRAPQDDRVLDSLNTMKSAARGKVRLAARIL